MDLRFAILGQTALRVGDRLGVQWGPPKLRALLAALLVRPGESVPARELVDWVWTGDDLPENPGQALYLYASRIRRILKEYADGTDIFVDNRNFRLEVDPLAVDYFQFREQLGIGRALARRGEHQRALDVIGGAFRLWRQRPLADVSGDEAEQVRQSMRKNVLLPAYDTLFTQQLLLGEADAVLAKLDELRLDYRSHIALLKRRLEALHALSRRDEATQEFLVVHRELSADFDDIGAQDLREFYERLKESAAESPVPHPVAAVRVPSRLPPPVTTLVGHETLLAKLDAVTTRPGVVVVDGTGGVGKTAFVVYWAHTALARFPDGVLYIDLHGFSDAPIVEPATAVDRFLEGFGVPADRIPNPQQRAAKLQSLLHGRQVLAVLDNARDTDHVRPLLPILSAAVVVIASRSQLSGLAARQTPYRFPIVPLDVEQSARLLSEHIGERAKTHKDTVLHLAKLCGGLPIALKMLAQYIAARPTVPLPAFAAQLGHDVRLLDIGSLGDGANHGPRAVFAQSVRALAPEVHRLFRLLGTHSGPDFGVGVAAALIDTDARRTRLALDALVEANLLEQSGALGRYKFHDLIREYAVELLESPEERRAAEIGALKFYLHTAENADRVVFRTQARVRTPTSGEHRQAIEFQDEEAARMWAVAERHNITAITRKAVEAGYENAAQMPQLAGQILLRNGYGEDALAILHAGLAASVAEDNREEEANALQNIALVHLNRQEFGAAAHYAHLAHLKSSEICDELGVAAALHVDARIRVETNDIQMGVECHERALRAIRRVGEKGMEAVFLYRTGEAYQRASEFERAASLYRESLALARDLADHGLQGRALVLLGSLAFAREQTAEARDYLRAGLEHLAKVHDIPFAGTACGLLAKVEFEAGRLYQATQYGRQSLRMCRRVMDSRGEADVLETLGKVLRATGRHEAAIEAWEQAGAIFADLDPERARAAAKAMRQSIDLAADLSSVRQASSPTARRTRESHPQ
ncbi:tetratricopeptide (TPR) repeat protein [Saccharothrix tamanrassetensis]|uniref:Tetratricopeptide (TPR) repeat protein n=1 Tax=Saccharothrix tamanrassetensis TaxID=1051531 RepID=A0A841CQR3_9PSEU|nr:tetratricopeptide repeat protein [Saccharothrix tamanrassetensis]MBB5959560.1 tetratricopeptide (TPR) repeat protein [Saccharothrix tamanrassetensis]